MESESNAASPQPLHAPGVAPIPERAAPRRALGPPPANAVDLLLRRPDALLVAAERDGFAKTLVRLSALALAGYCAYGLVVGSFSGGAQWWAAPLKISLGTALCGAICFPSLYICLSLCGA